MAPQLTYEGIIPVSVVPVVVGIIGAALAAI